MIQQTESQRQFHQRGDDDDRHNPIPQWWKSTTRADPKERRICSALGVAYQREMQTEVRVSRLPRRPIRRDPPCSHNRNAQENIKMATRVRVPARQYPKWPCYFLSIRRRHKKCGDSAALFGYTQIAHEHVEAAYDERRRVQSIPPCQIGHLQVFSQTLNR